MTSKCLLEYLLIRIQPSTSTGRGLWSESRGLVGTWVEGCISLIRFIQTRDREFCRGCRHLFSNYYEENEFRGKEEGKAYRDNNRAKYLHPLLPQPLELATMEGSMTDRRNERDDERKRTEDEQRREERGRRSEELQESWRHNHPSEQEEERKDRPKRRRQA